MSAPCIVVALINPLPEHYDRVIDVLRSVIPDVHDEDGCELYALHEAVDGRIIFVEKWTTREKWQAHMGLSTVDRIREGVAGLLQKNIEVIEAYGLEIGDPAKGLL